jgi:hypothetical protein
LGLVFFYEGIWIVSLGLGGTSLGCFLLVASIRLRTPSLGILLVLSLNLSKKFECISSIIKIQEKRSDLAEIKILLSDPINFFTDSSSAKTY